jgi:hypothetical protein
MFISLSLYFITHKTSSFILSLFYSYVYFLKIAPNKLIYAPGYMFILYVEIRYRIFLDQQIIKDALNLTNKLCPCIHSYLCFH